MPTQPKPLTDKQRIVYALAVHFFAATGEPCSVSYLSRRLGKHRSTIRAHLRAMRTKGWITAKTPAFRRAQP